MTLEDDLRNAMQQKADGVEPAPESYVKLAAKVDNGSTGSSRRGDRVRFLAVAAGIIAVIGSIGLYVVNSDDNDVVAGPATSTATTLEATADDPTTTETVAVGTEAPPLQGFVAGPIAPTREGAAAAFLELIGVANATVAIDGNVAEVQTPNEDGSIGRVVSLLDLARVEAEDGYAVTAARSDDVVIDAPTPPASASYDVYTDNSIAIEGSGHGFEATLDIKAVSALDGTLLATNYTTAGNYGELTPYETSVQVFGDGRAWIVVSSATGADNVVPAFAAVPISYETLRHPDVYTVVGVPDDDPDGGLNVREAPDTGVVLAVLLNGTTDIHLRSLVPVTVGDQEWWNIETSEVEGWVNSTFLVDVEAAAVAELEQLAVDFEAAMKGDPALIAELPWPSEGNLQVGWYQNLLEVSAETIATPEYWTDERTILEDGMAESSGLVTSLREFVSSPIDDLSAQIGFEMASPYGLDQDVHADMAQDREFVTLLYEDEFTAFRIITLYVEPSADGPVIADIGVAIWIP